MDDDMDQPEIDRHSMLAGMLWIGLCLIAAIATIAVALLLASRPPHHPPNCPHPEQATQSTFPIDCR